MLLSLKHSALITPLTVLLSFHIKSFNYHTQLFSLTYIKYYIQYNECSYYLVGILYTVLLLPHLLYRHCTFIKFSTLNSQRLELAYVYVRFFLFTVFYILFFRVIFLMLYPSSLHLYRYCSILGVNVVHFPPSTVMINFAMRINHEKDFFERFQFSLLLLYSKTKTRVHKC
jgi:hypothetical protein